VEISAFLLQKQHQMEQHQEQAQHQEDNSNDNDNDNVNNDDDDDDDDENGEQDLHQLVRENHWEKVIEILENHPSVDVNTGDGGGTTLLHHACDKQHPEVINLLLEHPLINVNQRDNAGQTPLYLACWDGQVKATELLLRDPRVDISIPDNRGGFPLWWAAFKGRVECVKWLIALRRKDLLMEKTSRWNGKAFTAIGIAKEKKNNEVLALLEGFKKSPIQTEFGVRLELGFVSELAAELFALMVLLCDDFLRIREDAITTPTTTTATTTTTTMAALGRFYRISMCLPMELQMVLCHHVYGSSKQNILSKDSEAAFKFILTKTFTK
jgi:hypothetical protein